jgi:hypothetical protein
MKKTTIEQLLVESQPVFLEQTPFVNQTMKKIMIAKNDETFSRALRNTDIQNKETMLMKLHNMKSNILKLPAYLVLAIGVTFTSTVSAATYIAFKWINPEVQIIDTQIQNDDGSKQLSVNLKCNDLSPTAPAQYEIAKTSSLTDEDAYKALLNNCKYTFLQSFIDSHWESTNGHDEVQNNKIGDPITIYQSTNVFAGSTDSNSVFGITIGTVTEITTQKITIASTLYEIDNSAASRSNKYIPSGRLYSRTLNLAPDTEVWENGNMLKLASINVGDTVQLVIRTENKTQYYQDIKQKALGEQTRFDVAGIVKNDIDTRYIRDVGDPAIVNGLIALLPCENNIEYSCVNVPNGQYLEIFSLPGNNSETLGQVRIGEDVTYRTLDCRVSEINGSTLIVKTRGKVDTTTIELPTGTVEKFNASATTKKPLQATHLPLEVGDLIEIRYGKLATEALTDIQTRDIQRVSLIQQVQPNGSISKY